ncbi:hypothetical protein IWQ60_000030 [Tieghemiomyces parasiticus]|uniref:Uncharacterized protein n=1 Tax=Tieghemiomyces parasiticus TaxID=78921 RepID=A0A9W8AJA7_9FUNG|nr:hypothetical protein IWQ60_000030 [Tieghemiomyces parasiticus]
MKSVLSFLTCLFSLTAMVLAGVSVTEPSSSIYAVEGEPLYIRWDLKDNYPSLVSIFLQGQNQKFVGDYAVANAISTADRSTKIVVERGTVGDNWVIVMRVAGVDPAFGSGTEVARSQPFSIREAGTKPTQSSAASDGSQPTAQSSDDDEHNSAVSSHYVSCATFALVVGGVLAMSFV